MAKKLSNYSQLLIPVIAILLLILFNLFRDPDFFSVGIAANNNGFPVLQGNLISILNGASELVVLSMGMTLVTAASGGQDISVGALAAIAGLVFMMHVGAGNATNANASEMNAIASSIIGGTLLTGGVGNVAGTFFGVLTLTTIKAIVVTSGLRDPWWQSITTGVMLCFFIILQSIVLSRRGKGGLHLPGWIKR